jgi:transposase
MWGVAGIDPHKRTFTVAVLDERGGVHGVASFATSDQGPDAALAWLDAVEFDLNRVGVEGSAWLGSQVATFLAGVGYDVREVQASRTAERRRRRRRAKTTPRTPRRSPARPWPIPTCHPPASSTLLDPDWDELVALRNQRRSLIAQRRRLLNEAEWVLVGLPLVVRAVLPATSQVRPRLRALARGAADRLELAGADRVHLAWLAASTADIARLDQRIGQLDQRIPAVLARLGCSLTEEVGIAAVGAMELLVEVGDPTRFATEARFARWCGAAPLAVSSEKATVTPCGTASIWAATAGSTRCCTPCTSPRRAATSPPRTTWPPSAPSTRPPEKPAAPTSGCSPTSSSGACGPTTNGEALAP